MARSGLYYIITPEQAKVLDVFDIPYQELGGLLCVEDWDAVTARLEAIVWEDGDVDDTEAGYLDIMYNYEDYMYWSAEAHSWV